MTHKIYSPNLEDFHFQDVFRGYFISPLNIPGVLAPITFYVKNMNISENGRPVKAILKNFCIRFGNTHMPSIGRGMTVGDDALYFFIKDASAEDSIDTSL